jgi:hypothetical protein
MSTEYLRRFADRGRFSGFLALFLFAMIPQLTFAAPAQAAAMFTVSKKLCAGAPAAGPFDPLNDSAGCAASQTVAVNTPAYYVITLTNPPGQPSALVTLQDAFPSFALTGPVTCRDSTGTAVPLLGTTAPDGIGDVALGFNTTLVCFAPGTFTAAGQYSNTVTATGRDGNSITGSTNTNVVAATPLNVDLSVSKSVTPTGVVDVTGGPQTLTYTIVIKNNSSTAVFASNFVLHDNLRLLGFIPLNVSLGLAQCMASPGTDCLNPAGPVPASAQPLLVGTVAAHPWFDWGFASGDGDIAAGGTITLTFTATVAKLPMYSCVQALNADGLRNTAFFTLTNTTLGTAQTELNPANNTATADKTIRVGTNVVPNCGQGPIVLQKLRLTPQPPPGFAWNTPFIEYEIRLTNTSAQPIPISGAAVRDLVTQGSFTPPFKRATVSATCLTINGVPCTPLPMTLSGIFQYTYYLQTAQAWQTGGGGGFTLNAGGVARFRTRLRYFDPDCATPSNLQREIINIGTLDYVAPPIGSSGPPQAFHAQAQVPVRMANVAACNFVATKTVTPSPNGAPAMTKVEFAPGGGALFYRLTFTNNGAARPVATVADYLRITAPNYALGLAFRSNWSCSGPVGNLKASGQINGVATFVTTPLHGAPTIDLRLNPSQPLTFGTNATLTCNVRIEVNRPAYGDPFCDADQFQLENAALMDPTFPFNPNPFGYPPAMSGVYNPLAANNPTPQNRNWASVKLPLPRCYNAIVNKQATVDGMPAVGAPWTWAGPGAPDIHYRITTTNAGTGTTPLTGSINTTTGAINGLVTRDFFVPPYMFTGLVPDGPLCAPMSWCVPSNLFPYLAIGTQLLAPQQSGDWVFRMPGLAVQPNSVVKNCATVAAGGTMFGLDWYANYNTNEQMPSPGVSTVPPNPRHACVSIPVIPTTNVTVTKRVLTPQGTPLLPGNGIGPFQMQLSCVPYAIPNGSFGMFTNAGGTSSSTVTHVPMGAPELCTLTETNLAQVPIPTTPAPLCAPPLMAQWDTPLITPAGPFTPGTGAGQTSQVTVTNKIVCRPRPTRDITVIKRVFSAPNIPAPSGPFTIQLNCGGPNAGPAVTMNAGQQNVQVPLGTTCIPTEPGLPPVPVVPGKTCQWATSFAPASFPVTGGPQQVLQVNNRLVCQ